MLTGYLSFRTEVLGLREELEGLDVETVLDERLAELLLGDGGWNVAQVQGGRWRVDVLVVLAAGLLEPVQRVLRVVTGQAGVGLSLLGQLHRLVFARHHADRFAPETQFVKVRHR